MGLIGYCLSHIWQGYDCYFLLDCLFEYFCDPRHFLRLSSSLQRKMGFEDSFVYCQIQSVIYFGEILQNQEFNLLFINPDHLVIKLVLNYPSYLFRPLSICLSGYVNRTFLTKWVFDFTTRIMNSDSCWNCFQVYYCPSIELYF